MIDVDYYFLNNHSLLAGELGLSVVSIGHSRPKIPINYEPKKRVNYYTISYLRKGEGYFESDSCELTKVKAGDLLLAFPGQQYKYGPEEDSEWDEYWVELRGFIIDIFREKLLLTPKAPIINIGRKLDLVKEWGEAIYTVQQKDKNYKEFMTGKMLKILCTILVYCFNKKEKEYTPNELLVRQVINLLKKNIAKPDKVQSLCKSFEADYFHIKKIFKKHMDTSPEQYFNMLRMDEAKENLLYSNESIRKVGEIVGINDPAYFSRVFKKYAGYSPMQFRKFFKKPY